jgi:hypothetical protein
LLDCEDYELCGTKLCPAITYCTKCGKPFIPHGNSYKGHSLFFDDIFYCDEC